MDLKVLQLRHQHPRNTLGHFTHQGHLHIGSKNKWSNKLGTIMK